MARSSVRRMVVRTCGAPRLGFDGAEVLHVPANTAAGVLPEPTTTAGKWIASRAAR
jgi:hypothetical protein